MIVRLRLYSGLVLFVFVLGHLINHSLGIISLEVMEAGRVFSIAPWRTGPGTVLLLGALLAHTGLSLWSLYQRRSLRLGAWELAQLILGLLIPLMLASHVIATRVLTELFQLEGSYTLELLALWVVLPNFGVLQAATLLVVWAHSCIGLHTWLRLKPWYVAYQQAAFALALLIPTLALSGYVATGVRVRAMAADEAWVNQVMVETHFRPEMLDFIFDWTYVVLVAFTALLVLVLAARVLRAWIRARSGAAKLYYRDNRVLDIQPGATVLEMLRAADIPHASVCGGRGRCSTCRVRVGEGAAALAPPSAEETRVLERISAPAGVRLACQIRPVGALEVTPLLPPAATARDGLPRQDYMQGQEREIAVLFADMRGFTQLSANKLPYDVVFVLNRYFAAMGQAVQESGGRLDKFIGDGVMALFGVESGADEGCRNALAAARAMAEKLEELNEGLAGDLAEPMRIGVGIHVGPVIVGEMGYAEAKNLTAIGEVVNVASRLETMTKEFGVQLVVSEEVARRGALDLDRFTARAVEVRGLADTMRVCVIGSAKEIGTEISA